MFCYLRNQKLLKLHSKCLLICLWCNTVFFYLICLGLSYKKILWSNRVILFYNTYSILLVCVCKGEMIYHMFTSLPNSVQHHKERQRCFHDLEHYAFLMNKISWKSCCAIFTRGLFVSFTFANISSEDLHLPAAVIPQGFILLFIIISSSFCIFTGAQYQQLQYLQNICIRFVCFFLIAL